MSRPSFRGLATMFPAGLAGRLALLLASALVVVNLVALAVLSFEQERLGQELRENRELERLTTLVRTLEAVPPGQRAQIAQLAADRMSEVSVDQEPLLSATSRTTRASDFVAQIAEALPTGPREIRVATHESVPGEQRHAAPGEIVVLSVALRSEGEGPQWLNLVAQPFPARLRARLITPLLVLFLSLVTVLAVGLLFVRRLTRPLAALADAARAAGRGNRMVRVPERGGRELRETAQAFNDMQERIAKFEAERTRTLAAVGHDLRTPITSLFIRAEMLEDAEREPILRTLEDMRVMADGLVAYARGQSESEPMVPVDLAALLARLCGERGAELCSAEPAVVQGRPVALSRAFGNLIDNALRYGGGADVVLRRRQGQAVVTVEDEGPGIPPDRIIAMFDPFVRGEGSRSSETGGAGLGLSIAQTIIRAMGGEILIENRETRGLSASVTLPLTDPARPEAAS